MATPLETKPAGDTTYHACTKKGNSIRCECGGQVAVGGTVHLLIDIGFGFPTPGSRRFEVRRTYSKKVSGYTGFCMTCRKQGSFLLK